MDRRHRDGVIGRFLAENVRGFLDISHAGESGLVYDKVVDLRVDSGQHGQINAKRVYLTMKGGSCYVTFAGLGRQQDKDALKPVLLATWKSRGKIKNVREAGVIVGQMIDNAVGGEVELGSNWEEVNDMSLLVYMTGDLYWSTEPPGKI